jgi:outer membrane protein
MLHSRLRALITTSLLLLPAALRADTLLDIYELAVKNDPVIKAAEATYRAGKEYEVQGRSPLLPQIGAQAEYGETDVTQKSTRTFQFGDSNFSSNTDYDVEDEEENYYLTLSQRLFDVPAWFSFKQGKELSKQAAAQFAADQQELIVRTVEAYVLVLRAIDNLKSSRAAEAAYQRQLEQTQQRFEVGLIAITDVHEARAAYDLAVVDRLTDEGNLGVAYEALSVLTGQSHANLWLLSEEFPVVDPQPATAEGWVELAMEGNLNLKVSDYAAEAAMQYSQASRAQHLPKLTGQVNLMDTSTDGNNLDNIGRGTYPATVDTEGNSFTIALSMPLYAGGGISSQRRQSYENYITARETHTSIMRDTIQYTRSLHLFVTTDVQRVKARKQAIVSAQSALDATTAGYEVGTRNVVDVLNAQQVLFTAIRDYANTRYDYVVRLLRLRKQAGMLSPEDVVALNRWLVEPKPPTASTPAT